MNTETIVHPRLHHLGITTSNIDAMISWYRVVVGMDLVHRTDSATASTDGAPVIKSAWLTNDEANHRLAFVELPGLRADADKAQHRRIQHFAFAYRTLDELLGTYVRLKTQGITPVLCTDAGAQTAFYYADPDGNSVELHVDNYGDSWTSMEHMRHSTEFAAKPIGHFVDPDKLVKAREAGTSPSELSKRAWRDEFAPAKPYDPSDLL
ncbi:VOC family protein [Saccharopolyspora sp. K220]|uniref:VOC family protein n=1 Tax=Saccharopolyspora soli TaxID=2926618 RepID=UPI001F5A0551|nr:VOC family protein [Saccharopolyspora soli]MCI2423394.1 VOC family protein [Saccharopolyspora soli]